MAKAVAVTPAQVKAARMRVDRMRERGETPPEKLVKIANATGKSTSDDDVDSLREYFSKVMENALPEPGLFSVPADSHGSVLVLSNPQSSWRSFHDPDTENVANLMGIALPRDDLLSKIRVYYRSTALPVLAILQDDAVIAPLEVRDK